MTQRKQSGALNEGVLLLHHAERHACLPGLQYDVVELFLVEPFIHEEPRQLCRVFFKQDVEHNADHPYEAIPDLSRKCEPCGTALVFECVAV